MFKVVDVSVRVLQLGKIQMLSDEFIQMTRCLETGTSLHLAEPPCCERLNRAITAGKIQNRMGQLVQREIEAGLVNEDQSLLYPIYDDIPQLLLDEAIPLSQLDDADNGPKPG